MAITIITGVPGTGKTAKLVSLLEEIAATGRTIFVDNIPELKLPHYRAGNITQWQKGTWLHIDRYIRTAPALAMESDSEEEDNNGNENWEPHPDVFKAESGELRILARDAEGNVKGSVPYESHKGALLVIDEAQRHFRPRPAGSPVPDHVAALEVHRHQGLDIWLVTQRPGLLDSNVRALCGKHIALRSTPFGRYQYEWPEVGDIESKVSRDTAAKSRYRLPKHVFGLYKSAEAHTKHKHTLPLAAKALLVLLPLAVFLFYNSYNIIHGKFNPEQPQPAQAEPAKHQPGAPIQQAKFDADQQIPEGFEPFNLKEISNHHPFERNHLSIVARLKSATNDVYRFSASENGQHAFYISSKELEQAGYAVVPLNDCSVKLIYQAVEMFLTCNMPQQSQPVHQLPLPPQQFVQGAQFEPYTP